MKADFKEGNFVLQKAVVKIVCQPALLPVFAQWQAQRVQCESCAWSRLKSTCLSCVNPAAGKVGARWGGGRAACIEARGDGKACGPDARLWVARPETAA